MQSYADRVYEEYCAFTPNFPAMLTVAETMKECEEETWLWRGEIVVTRRQYSLWIGSLFIGEIVYDNPKHSSLMIQSEFLRLNPWRAELSTQKYLKTIGRYKTDTEAHNALLDAAVDAFFGK